MKQVDKLWGREEWIVNEPEYCAKYLHIKKGASGSLHYHSIKKESFLCLSGLVKLELEGEVIDLTPEKLVTIMPNQKHRISGITDGVILEISTHHDDSDSYRLINSTGGNNASQNYKGR